jgi:hypothetical protein
LARLFFFLFFFFNFSKKILKISSQNNILERRERERKKEHSNMNKKSNQVIPSVTKTYGGIRGEKSRLSRFVSSSIFSSTPDNFTKLTTWQKQNLLHDRSPSPQTHVSDSPPSETFENNRKGNYEEVVGHHVNNNDSVSAAVEAVSSSINSSNENNKQYTQSPLSLINHKTELPSDNQQQQEQVQQGGGAEQQLLLSRSSNKQTNTTITNKKRKKSVLVLPEVNMNDEDAYLSPTVTSSENSENSHSKNVNLGLTLYEDLLSTTTTDPRAM